MFIFREGICILINLD